MSSNSVKVTSVIDLMAAFPHKVPVYETLCYRNLSELKAALKANAGTVPRGGGRFGYLGIVLTTEEYELISPGKPFPVPTAVDDPDDMDETERDKLTNKQFERLRSKATKATAAYDQYNNVHQALRNLIHQVVPAVSLKALEHPETSYSEISVPTMLTHLFACHGRISPADMRNNLARMEAPWKPDQTFEHIVDQINMGQIFATAGRRPFDDHGLYEIAYELVRNKGPTFKPALDQWVNRPVEEKTWANFKPAIFAAEQRDLEDNPTTNKANGYYTANNARAKKSAKNSSNPPDSVSPTSNYSASATPSLMSQSENESPEYALMAKTLDTLVSKMNALTDSKTSGGPNKRQKREGSTPHVPNENYCWSHGYRVNAEHTSATCTKRNPGHIETATRADTKGGSTYGKNRIDNEKKMN
jgi:hypothetical protein